MEWLLIINKTVYGQHLIFLGKKVVGKSLTLILYRLNIVILEIDFVYQ